MALSRKISFVDQSNYRTGEPVVGVQDGSNTVFDSPEDFDINIEFFHFFRNGQLQELGVDYAIRVLSGVGVGVRMFRPPRPNDTLVLDYIAKV